MDPDFSQDELLRYSRQILLPQVGLEGQRKIKQASVLIIGMGGLGSASSLYLTAAGVGRIGLVDPDHVESSNLQRQILYSTNMVGELKTDAAQKRLSDQNPHCQIDVYPTLFTSENAEKIAKGYDILIDGTDNLPTRYLINDLCVLTSRPFVFGAIDRFEGQMALFNPPDGPCYRCVFGDPAPPENILISADTGVFGVLPGMVGLLQAAETLKFILDVEKTLAGKVVLVNSLDAGFEHVEVEKDKNCAVCGAEPKITSLTESSYI
ncbi:MAG: HesA/MoeB/ThiF family protein [Brevefilum sp.]